MVNTMMNHVDILDNLIGHYLGYDNYVYIKDFVRRLSGNEIELIDNNYNLFGNFPSRPALLNSYYTKFIGELFIPTAIDYLYLCKGEELPSDIVKLNKVIIEAYKLISYDYEKDSFTLNVNNLDAYIKTKYPYLERCDGIDCDKLTIIMNSCSNVKWRVICTDFKSKV
jgi:hypothetical protein